MHPIVIADDATFEAFESGQQVTINSLMTQDYINQIKKDKMRIEVWYKTNMPPHQHHIGRVLSFNGMVETIPKGKPDAISLTIQRI